MLDRTIRYYFARLNLIASYQSKADFLIEGLSGDEPVRIREHNWQFNDIGTMDSLEGEFITGYLVKYRPLREVEVVDPDTRQLESTPVQNPVVAKSRFFLHIESGLLAYHPITGQIDLGTFRDRFKTVFEYGPDQLLVDVDIQPITDRHQIFEEIQRFERITRVTIYLHPSNPSNSDLWKGIDERLKRLGVSSYREDYEAKKDDQSLPVVEDQEIRAKITMAKDGYGQTDVEGIQDGEKKTVSTHDMSIEAQAPNDEHPAETVLQVLMETIRRVFERFNR